MNSRKLTLPLLVALACIGAGATVLPATAATKSAPHKSQAKVGKLRIDVVRVATKAGPLTIRVAADARTEVRMTVNGKRVRTPFEFAGPKAQQVELRSVDGLRAGSNKLRITARRAGVVSKAARSVSVPAWALLADAGEDAGTPTHVRARVGTATAPGAGSDGGAVDYSWSIVGAPRGADARIADPDAPRPVLDTQDPGTYVLQEEADPEADGVPTAADQVTVAVAPNDPPIGVSIDTLDDNGAIVIGDKTYGGGSGSSYVVLERTTRTVVESGSVPYGSAGLAKLNDLAANYGGGRNYMRYLMIVNGRYGAPADQLDGFASLLKKLGAAPPTVDDVASLKLQAAYSVIGIPGAPAGAATIWIPSPASLGGALTGYLQVNQALDADGTPLYEYVSGEQPAFDTKADGSDDTTDEMVIDGKTYTGTLPGGTTAGLHVVALNSMTLRLISDQVLATNGTGSSRSLQSAAAGALEKAVGEAGGPTVFVQTIGKPAAAGPEWQRIVASLVRLGANPELVNALDGTTEYALVSRAGSAVPPAEVSTAYDHGPYEAPSLPPARLVGTLVRTRASNFVPNVSSTPTAKSPEGSVNLALTKIAYQPPQAWPDLPGTTDESSKAQKFLCEGMKFCQPTSSCPTVRECFWQRYGDDWNEKARLLTNVKYVDGKGFTETTFNGVKDELQKETDDVAAVKTYLRQLQEPFEKSGLGSYVDLQGISQKIWDSVQPPPNDNSTSFILGLIGKVAAIGGVAGGPVKAGAAGISAVFGIAAYLSDKSGQPILGAEIKARSSQLGSEMVGRIDLARQASVGLGKMIVSDYGKLTAADGHIDTDWALPDDIKPTVDAFRTSSKQWFYEALIPTAFPYLIRANSNQARNLDCDAGHYEHFGFFNQPDMFQMNATVGYNADGTAINADFFFTKGIGGAASPSASIGDEMFRPRSGPDPGLGMEKLQFFSPRVFGGRIVHAINGTYACSLGWLPGKF
jgi:hypothetical protein